jgi:hypothetical protein
MSIAAFLDAVDAIVERNIAANTPEKIPSELDNLISRSGVIRDYASGLISSAGSFVTDNTTQPEQEVFGTIAKQGEADFAKTVKGVMKDVSQDVVRLLRQDKSIKEVSERLQLRYGRLRNVADTIALTSRTALSRANRINKAEKAGVKRLKYFGAPAERDFCVEHLDNIYTIEQIRQMDNGQGLEVLYYMGGFRCRHSWLPVLDV